MLNRYIHASYIYFPCHLSFDDTLTKGPAQRLQGFTQWLSFGKQWV